jgi:hypothetical protein
MQYLSFDLSEGSDGVTTLDALASTSAAQHAAVLAEAQDLLAWCRREFPHTEGAVDEGMDWDHELQVSVEDGGWHSVALTLTGSPRFVEAFLAAFGDNAG